MHCFGAIHERMLPEAANIAETQLFAPIEVEYQVGVIRTAWAAGHYFELPGHARE